MFKNYFKIAFRSLWRNKSFSAINIFGLALGIASCLVILLFVSNELSYDRFNKNAGRIVRVIFRGSVQGEKMREAAVMPPTAQTLLADYPEVEQATRIRDFGSQRITYGDKTFSGDRFAFADANIFQVFTLPLIAGDPKTALLQPNTVVITKALAQKYFGTTDAVGKELNIKSFNRTFKITGVMKDIPANSHFQFGLFAAMEGLPEAKEPTWMTSNFHTYLLLPQGYDYKK
ncbi:MAG TPA: ABC transporter permease, partial [Flavisolibacter sp.]|nr:ABC transporter permease [Flavisolibacter sp.]